MDGITILIVEDDADITALLCYNLRKEGYEVATAQNGVQGVNMAKKLVPDLILMDVMMPEKDGLQALSEMRAVPRLANTPILLLTAKGGEDHEIHGLNLGADDYLTKPIKPALLLSRIRAALRRGQREGPEELTKMFGALEINQTRFLVRYQNNEIALARKEFELLSLLASKPGKVFLRQEILDSVWGTDVIVGDRTIDVHVRKIRQKVGLPLIGTVKGVGYKFEPPIL